MANAPVFTGAARRSVEEAWLRILRRRHPEVTWTIQRKDDRPDQTVVGDAIEA
jgi:hypothetical protein